MPELTETSETSVRSETFAFTKLVVDDLDAETRFYEDVFRLSTLRRVQAEVAGSPIDEIILGGEAGVSIILLTWPGRPTGSRGEVILGVTTSDIASLFTRAEAAGGRVRQAPESSPEAGGASVGFLEDPEGHLIEVVEQVTA